MDGYGQYCPIARAAEIFAGTVDGEHRAQHACRLSHVRGDSEGAPGTPRALS